MSLIRRIIIVGLGLVIVLSTKPSPEAPPAVTLSAAENARFFETLYRPRLNILVIGSDVREGDPREGRADSLHLLTIDTRKRRGTIVGIPRDSWVPVPGHGTTKINASLFFGGPELVVKTVTQLTGIPIHYWALIEFSRFRQLIDALGGIVVRVPYNFEDSAAGAFFGPGKNLLNGADALAFSRARKSVPGGDFGRTENQGRLLIDALYKFRKESVNPITLFKYLRAFDQYVESNVPIRDLLKIAEYVRITDPSDIKNVVAPGHGGSAGGASVVFLEPGATEMFRNIKGDAVL